MKKSEPNFDALCALILAEVVYYNAVRNMANIGWEFYSREDFVTFNPKIFNRPHGAAGRGGH